MPTTATTRPTRRRDPRPYLAIAALGVALYLRSLSFGLTHLDDIDLVVDAQFFLRDLANVVTAFGKSAFYMIHGQESYYRPLLTVSFIVDTRLNGGALVGYHVTNLALHILACSLALRALVKLGCARGPALVCALWMVVQPALSQAVAWIPGRNDSLLAVFVLLSFSAFVDHLETRSTAALLGHLLAFALALFTKETAVGLPVMCVLYVVLMKSWRLLGERLGRLLLGWIPLLILWWIAMTAALPARPGQPFLALGQDKLANLPGIVQLLGKAIFPIHLSVMAFVGDTPIVIGLVALVVLGAGLARSPARNLGAVLFGCAWFLVFLAPTLVTSKSLMLEHRLYVPFFGLLVVVSELEPVKRFRIDRRGHQIVAAAVILLFAGRCYTHALCFRSEEAFNANAVETSPHSSSAHLGQATFLHREGRLDDAEGEYRKTLELDPASAVAHNNLGVLLMNRGNLGDAERELKRELAGNPGYDRAYVNLGLVYALQQRIGDAERMWVQALEINPNNEEPRRLLARLHASPADGAPPIGAKPGAEVSLDEVPSDLIIRTYEQGLADDPRNVTLRRSFARFCASRRLPCAREQWKRLLEDHPGDGEADRALQAP